MYIIKNFSIKDTSATAIKWAFALKNSNIASSKRKIGPFWTKNSIKITYFGSLLSKMQKSVKLLLSEATILAFNSWEGSPKFSSFLDLSNGLSSSATNIPHPFHLLSHPFLMLWSLQTLSPLTSIFLTRISEPREHVWLPNIIFFFLQNFLWMESSI